MTTEEKAKAYDEALRLARSYYGDGTNEFLDTLFPELRESEDERTRKEIIGYFNSKVATAEETELLYFKRWIAYLEKQKENPKSADSIPADCVSDAKCENRWHKVGDSLPDNGRLVLAQDNLGNRLLARYDGEDNWEVSVYDNEDYYCRNTITKWCEIPSEKQKEQKPAEWSEEDQLNLNWVIAILNGEPCDLDIQLESLISWLKSLRPSWKPSEEQMDSLRNTIAMTKGSTCSRCLPELYHDLKKLM